MENQKKVWNKIAEKWAQYRTETPITVKRFLEDKLGKILDLGCGSGRNCIKLNKNEEYYCLDFSSEMLKKAKENLKNQDVKFILSETNNIPFEDNFFDSCICYAVLHCIREKEKRTQTLQEIYRTLKIGSYALISVWSKNSPRLKNKEKECFIPWTTKENDKTKRYTYVYDLEELKKEIEKVNFKIIKIWEERNINVIVQKI